MKWNCNNCGREIISEKENKCCLECWWKQQIEKTEITSETIRSFMEKHWISLFSFNRGSYSDVLYIGLEDLKTSPAYKQSKGLEAIYYPGTKKNLKIAWTRVYFSEYTAFLEKLFHFAQSEKIKSIRNDWKTEKNSNGETLFKVRGIIIEKKTSEEIEE